MENLNRQLKQGTLPRELNYSIDDNIIDWNKLQYNNRYQSFEFYASKFPRGWDQEELFIPIIEHIADKAKINKISPLDELNKIYDNINIE